MPLTFFYLERSPGKDVAVLKESVFIFGDYFMVVEEALPIRNKYFKMKADTIMTMGPCTTPVYASRGY